jgi:DNA-binding LacI/PurR family transcriptional regulator
MAPDRSARGDSGDRAPGDRLDAAILRATPEFNAVEVAEHTGVTVDQARRLWRALGFPEFVGEKAHTAADVEAGATLGRHLAELGHTRVGVIADTGYPAGTVTTGLTLDDITCTDCRARLQGLGSTLDELVIVSGGHNAPVSGVAAGAALLDLPDRPTAIVGLSDVVALGVLEAMRERGLRAPQDVSVSGFDDIADAASAGLTTVRQPILEKGRRVGELLLDAQLEPRQVLLPIELVVRTSTGVPAS